jgi:DNA-binding transcriptional LysR family regulator
MYERAYAPGFHNLIVGMLRDARIVPNVYQTVGEISTLVSLVDAHMGIAILPLSAVKHSVASVVACETLCMPIGVNFSAEYCLSSSTNCQPGVRR